MERNVNSSAIALKTSLAINAMNVNWSFSEMKTHLEQAFGLCSPYDDLEYYGIIASVFENLQFQTATGSQTKKLRKQYLLMYDYLDEKFSTIGNFDLNPNDESELSSAIEICKSVCDGAVRYGNAFISAAASQTSIMVGIGVFLGLVGSLFFGLIYGIPYGKIKKKFKKHIKSFEKNAKLFLSKYENNATYSLEKAN